MIADQKKIRWSADLNAFFVEGRHLGITCLIASQYVKGVGPMVRQNCDYIFVQPIYNSNQRQTLWEMEAAFLDKKVWYELMDTVIRRWNLPGATLAEPRKKVRIMVSVCSEETPHPQEKLFHWTPVHSSELPAFKLCHPSYWKQSQTRSPWGEAEDKRSKADKISAAFEKLGALQ